MLSCIKSIDIEEDYSDVLKALYEYRFFKNIIEEEAGFKSDTITFLKNDYTLKLDTYSNGIYNDKRTWNELLSERNNHFLFINKIIVDDNLARIDITFKKSVLILISLEKSQPDEKENSWFVTHYFVYRNGQLYENKGVQLVEEIWRKKKLDSLSQMPRE